MNEDSKSKKAIKTSIISFILVLVAAIIALIILRYHVEGEENMPFEVSQLLVVSTAEGYQKDQNSKKNWDVNIYQTNDIYLNIKKNKNYKDTEIIKSIKIQNIKVEENPTVGNINIYIPDGENQTYSYSEKSKRNSEIVFEGDKKSDIKNLKISNQGGTILFRIVNDTQKRYTSNEEVLKHDGTLLKKVGIKNEEIKLKISFEIVICLESDKSFVGMVEIELPAEDITSQGIANFDKKDVKDIVFKRE